MWQRALQQCSRFVFFRFTFLTSDDPTTVTATATTTTSKPAQPTNRPPDGGLFFTAPIRSVPACPEAILANGKRKNRDAKGPLTLSWGILEDAASAGKKDEESDGNGTSGKYNSMPAIRERIRKHGEKNYNKATTFSIKTFRRFGSMVTMGFSVANKVVHRTRKGGMAASVTIQLENVISPHPPRARGSDSTSRSTLWFF